MMEDDAQHEPVFRANKRRKVFRKRRDSEEDDLEAGDAELNKSDHSQATESVPIVPHRRLGARKNGIAFSSNGMKKTADEEEDGTKALVLAQFNDEQQQVVNGDRFVKPMGRVAVTEDKHMTAFIDSKLAEARSVTPLANGGSHHEKDAGPVGLTHSEREAEVTNKQPSEAMSSERNGERTYQTAQARSTRVYQRPTKKRRPPQRDEADIARDTMIDQLMHEAQVPIYEQTAQSSTAAEEGDDVDNDAATAEAFKAQLVAEMEMYNRRKPASKTASKDAKASTGPKLGGSRKQREKMKALEEATKSGGVKK